MGNKIVDLKPGDTKVIIEKARVSSINQTRDVAVKGRPARVADTIITDDTGEIKLSLWDDMIEKVQVDDIIEISNAYVTFNSFEKRNQLNLSVGGIGKVSIISESGDRIKLEQEMHKATCADCGKECEVPFKPAEGRPVYCRDCKKIRKGNESTKSDKKMHDAVCSECGNDCKVPFKPAEGRPVYCKECMKERRSKK